MARSAGPVANGPGGIRREGHLPAWPNTLPKRQMNIRAVVDAPEGDQLIDERSSQLDALAQKLQIGNESAKVIEDEVRGEAAWAEHPLSRRDKIRSSKPKMRSLKIQPRKKPLQNWMTSLGLTQIVRKSLTCSFSRHLKPSPNEGSNS